MQRDFATLTPCAAEGARGDLRVTPRAEDGKTTTVKYTETGPEGKPVKGSAVYDKQ